MKMKKLRWATDGGGGNWELDASTPITLEGEARAVPGDPIPLGVSRGTRLSRPKQLHFFRRFMHTPFLLSYSSSPGFSLQGLLPLPTFTPNWFPTLMGQFNLQKFVSSLKEKTEDFQSSPLQTIGRHIRDKSLYALGFCSELLLTPDDVLLFSLDAYGYSKASRKKAILHHEFPHHNLTLEAAWPGLFVDKFGNYWDVPLSLAVDLASVGSESGSSYHLCLHHNVGWPKQFDGDQSSPGPPVTLLPGTSVKSSFSLKKDIEFWRSKAKKLKMVQPFDAFLSNPHFSASGIIGAAVTACLGDTAVRYQGDDSEGFRGFCLRAPAVKSAVLADIFSSVSVTAQHGNFQRLFLDLTRFHVRLDFPSGSKFLSGAMQLAQDFFYSRQPTMKAVQAICPNATISLQQQIAGPLSLRVDYGLAIDWKNRDWRMQVQDPVFAVEYALQVLGSAKAISWYSPKRQEFMMELRFFET